MEKYNGYRNYATYRIMLDCQDTEKKTGYWDCRVEEALYGAGHQRDDEDAAAVLAREVRDYVLENMPNLAPGPYRDILRDMLTEEVDYMEIARALIDS